MQWAHLLPTSLCFSLWYKVGFWYLSCKREWDSFCSITKNIQIIWFLNCAEEWVESASSPVAKAWAVKKPIKQLLSPFVFMPLEQHFSQTRLLWVWKQTIWYGKALPYGCYFCADWWAPPAPRAPCQPSDLPMPYSSCALPSVLWSTAPTLPTHLWVRSLCQGNAGINTKESDIRNLLVF